MPSLNSNALCTILELNTYLGGKALGGGTSADDLLTSGSFVQALNQASSYVESYLGYGTLIASPSGSLHNDIFDGLGYNADINFYHDTHKVSHPMLLGTPTLWYRTISLTLSQAGGIDLSNYGSWIPTSFDWNPTTSEIRILDGNCFLPGIRNWKVRYYYGFTSRANVSPDIKLATIMIAQYVLKHGEEGQVISTSVGDNSRAYALKLPTEALNILNRYKT